LRVDGNLVPDPAITNAARGARPGRAEGTTSRRTEGTSRGSDTAPSVRGGVLQLTNDDQAVDLADTISGRFSRDPGAAFAAQANVRPQHALALLSR
jgi:hypothetical protein